MVRWLDGVGCRFGGHRKEIIISFRIRNSLRRSRERHEPNSSNESGTSITFSGNRGSRGERLDIFQKRIAAGGDILDGLLDRYVGIRNQIFLFDSMAA